MLKHTAVVHHKVLHVSVTAVQTDTPCRQTDWHLRQNMGTNRPSSIQITGPGVLHLRAWKKQDLPDKNGRGQRWSITLIYLLGREMEARSDRFCRTYIPLGDMPLLWQNVHIFAAANQSPGKQSSTGGRIAVWFTWHVTAANVGVSLTFVLVRHFEFCKLDLPQTFVKQRPTMLKMWCFVVRN